MEQLDYAAGTLPTISLLDALGQPRPDGSYTGKVCARPVVSPGIPRELEQARETGDETVVPRLRRRGLLPRHPLVQSGSFSILSGSIVSGSWPEGDQDSWLSAVATPTDDLSVHAATTVISGDPSVWSSLCVGLDCTDAESFGFDTIRLKENNTRIKFADTSEGTFPTTDWQLTANDSASGGLSKFSIEDIDHARVPFTIEAKARTDALYVEDYGRIGIGTAVPATEEQIVGGDTPAVRLEQDTSSGWTAQSWDLAGYESNFFIRDVTHGSKPPFRIQPDTPSSTLDLKADGKVGIGMWSPAYVLVVERTGSDAEIVADRTDGAAGKLVMGAEASRSAQSPTIRSVLS